MNFRKKHMFPRLKACEHFKILISEKRKLIREFMGIIHYTFIHTFICLISSIYTYKELV